MINLDTVESEIIDLEKRDTTYAVVERLAWLYIVRDHILKFANAQASEETATVNGTSQFLSTVSGAPVSGVMNVLDEHMSVLMALYPKEYEAILRRIEALKTSV